VGPCAEREIEVREQLVAGVPAGAEVEQRVREEREYIVDREERVSFVQRDTVLRERERQALEAVAEHAHPERAQRKRARSTRVVQRELEVGRERERIAARVGRPAREREHAPVAARERLRHHGVAGERSVGVRRERRAREERAALEAGTARRTRERRAVRCRRRDVALRPN